MSTKRHPTPPRHAVNTDSTLKQRSTLTQGKRPSEPQQHRQSSLQKPSTKAADHPTMPQSMPRSTYNKRFHPRIRCHYIPPVATNAMPGSPPLKTASQSQWHWNPHPACCLDTKFTHTAGLLSAQSDECLHHARVC